MGIHGWGWWNYRRRNRIAQAGHLPVDLINEPGDSLLVVSFRTHSHTDFSTPEKINCQPEPLTRSKRWL